jgi:hypothetical protein
MCVLVEVISCKPHLDAALEGLQRCEWVAAVRGRKAARGQPEPCQEAGYPRYVVDLGTHGAPHPRARRNPVATLCNHYTRCHGLANFASQNPQQGLADLEIIALPSFDLSGRQWFHALAPCLATRGDLSRVPSGYPQPPCVSKRRARPWPLSYFLVRADSEFTDAGVPATPDSRADVGEDTNKPQAYRASSTVTVSCRCTTQVDSGQQTAFAFAFAFTFLLLSFLARQTRCSHHRLQHAGSSSRRTNADDESRISSQAK